MQRLLPVLFCAVLWASDYPLPELRTEPKPGGSIFHVHNTSSQPVTAYVIELVDYPGSSYSLWRDEIAAGEPIPPGGTKDIPVANMTVGAVPDYVKLTAALYADGNDSGSAVRVTQMIERRRAILKTKRELISRLDKAKADKT